MQRHLAPRFIVKFFSSVYTPLDKDIVREMWVQGDLKDQLGIGHRKARKNGKKGGEIGLEYAPMFHEPHSRSLSEVSVIHHQYEPAPTRSPGMSAAQRQTYLDTPPLSEAGDTPPRGLAARYIHNKSPLEQSHLSPASPADTHPRDERRIVAPSPRASYYSVSDLPPPSPVPATVYRYSNGDTTTTPPSRRSSVSRSTTTTRTSRAANSNNKLPLPLSSSLLMQSSDTLQLPADGRAIPGSPGTYEMRIRTPPGSAAQHGERSASDASFATAPDSWWSGDEDVHPHSQSPPHHPKYAYAHSPERTPRQSREMDDDDDRSTVVMGDRSHQHDGEYDYERSPSVTSWAGGVAM